LCPQSDCQRFIIHNFESEFLIGMFKFLKTISLNLLWYLNLFSVFLLLLSYTAPFVSPVKNAWLALLGLGYPFLLLINIFWFVFWLLRKSRAVYASMLTLILGATYIPTLIGFAKSTKAPDNAMRLMSYNVRFFNTPVYAKEARWIEQQNKIIAFIKSEKPDILAAQEFSGKGSASTNRAVELLKATGLKHIHRGGRGSLAIVSRFPIQDKGVLHFQGSANGAIYADLLTPKGKIRVYSVHLQSTRLGKDANEVLKKDNIKSIGSKETQEKYYRIEDKLSSAFAMRARQAEILREHIAASPHPVIVCGDFNDTPLSYSYRLMSKGLQDSFMEKGWGLGTSYAGALPALRIDYILCSQHFEIYTHQKQKNAISDHYAVFSDVGLF
jgi:endonuclease/exonuclease/phosphatase family metal-dependent hydrolase